MWARSYTLRAVLAIGFLVGFYLVAVGIALALFAIPYLEYVTLHRVHFFLVAVCVGGGATILYALIPRGTGWEDPGPRITAADHPRLFELIARVAGRMGVEVPAEVYLIPEVNAFVTQRGGFLGFGTRRVMAIGVPLLAIENVSQLEATIAHELGHYVGGETRLSGIVYATRRAMIATLVHLEKSDRGLLQIPFGWMLKVYMRITQAISRQQELLADSWSVRLAGREAHVTGLGLEHLHGMALPIFLHSEVVPLYRGGRAPENLLEGYRRFVASPGFARLGPELARAGREQAADPYDSHPALAERLAFAETVEGGPTAMDPTPAYALLSDAAKVEAAFSSRLTPEGMEKMSWDALGASWAAIWRAAAVRLATTVPGFDIAALERALADVAELGRVAEQVMPTLRGHQLPDRAERLETAFREHAAAWLASILAEHGWTWKAELGEPVLVQRGDVVFDARARLAAVMERKETAASLRAVAPEILREGVTLTLAEAERSPPPARKAAVQLTRGEQYTDVGGKLAELHFPPCCVVCTGPVDTQYQVAVNKVGFSVGSSGLSLALFACPRHVGDLENAVRVKSYDKSTGDVVLAMRSRAYAELMHSAST